MNTTNAIDEKLLDILVCPLTRSPLKLEGDWLVAQQGGLKYPIREGIPILLADQAQLPSGIDSLDAFKEKFKDLIPR